ncbi:DNA ligase-1 [Dyella sp. OK004]|uniref:DNA ligase n=1 Tax=Dyella sp. OK004 TaxID=1855292 RepID=UPI0008E5FE2D|nr:DNA ligase [Dyella sp. OK004]SFS06336.1 DNA ligase-1 [Dyella sp. OK004]
MQRFAQWARIFCALLIQIGLLASPICRAASNAAPVMLANVYHAGVDLDAYWVSEKYDGVRGYWDGERLFARSGAIIHAPAWFTAHWPRTPMDGELWAGRGKFDVASATIRQEPANDAAWRRIRFMVFDLPGHPGVFDERIPALNQLVARLEVPWVQAVRQYKVADEAALKVALRRVIKDGGEGLVLHRGESLYRAIRSDDLLKLKPYEDAEARVVAQLQGKGKYTGMMGSLLVEMPDGTQFRLGTGFTDEQRRHPPSVGSQVTYRYRGMTPVGKPRFASFLRVRE